MHSQCPVTKRHLPPPKGPYADRCLVDSQKAIRELHVTLQNCLIPTLIVARRPTANRNSQLQTAVPSGMPPPPSLVLIRDNVGYCWILLDPDPPPPPAPNKQGSPYNRKASKRIGGLGDPMAATKINKGRRDPSALIESIRTCLVQLSREKEGQDLQPLR